MIARGFRQWREATGDLKASAAPRPTQAYPGTKAGGGQHPGDYCRPCNTFTTDHCKAQGGALLTRGLTLHMRHTKTAPDIKAFHYITAAVERSQR
jgi:hypothetical protein